MADDIFTPELMERVAAVPPDKLAEMLAAYRASKAPVLPAPSTVAPAGPTDAPEASRIVEIKPGHLRDFVTGDNNVDLGKRTILAAVSTESVDSYRSVLIASGILDERYKKNPIVCIDHSYQMDRALGKCMKIVPEKGRVLALTHVNARPPAPLFPEGAAWMPDTVLWLYHAGDLRGWSVGFDIPSGGIREATEEERTRFGATVRQVIDRWEIIEYSAVVIPSNADALTLSKRGVSDRVIRWRERGNPLDLPFETIKREFAKGGKVFLLPPPTPAERKRKVADAVAAAFAETLRPAIADVMRDARCVLNLE